MSAAAMSADAWTVTGQGRPGNAWVWGSKPTSHCAIQGSNSSNECVRRLSLAENQTRLNARLTIPPYVFAILAGPFVDVVIQLGDDGNGATWDKAATVARALCGAVQCSSYVLDDFDITRYAAAAPVLDVGLSPLITAYNTYSPAEQPGCRCTYRAGLGLMY